jgi:hypothetical protein
MFEMHGDDDARDFLGGIGLKPAEITVVQSYYDTKISACIFRVLVGVGLAHACLAAVLVVLLLS